MGFIVVVFIGWLVYVSASYVEMQREIVRATIAQGATCQPPGASEPKESGQ